MEKCEKTILSGKYCLTCKDSNMCGSWEKSPTLFLFLPTIFYNLPKAFSSPTSSFRCAYNCFDSLWAAEWSFHVYTWERSREYYWVKSCICEEIWVWGHCFGYLCSYHPIQCANWNEQECCGSQCWSVSLFLSFFFIEVFPSSPIWIWETNLGPLKLLIIPLMSPFELWGKFPFLTKLI